MQNGYVDGIEYRNIGGEYFFDAARLIRSLGFTYVPRKQNRFFDPDVRLDGRRTISSKGLKSLYEAYPQETSSFITKFKNQILNVKRKDCPDFNNPSEMARAWAAQYEEIAALKTTIVNLREDLGDGLEYKSLRNIPWFKEEFSTIYTRFWCAVGLTLTHMSNKMGYSKKRVISTGPFSYLKISLYNVAVIDALRERIENEPRLLLKYRRKK